VLTLYLLPSLNVKLRPTILNMTPGTRVVSHAFNMGDWEADETATPDGRQVYLWIVPAKVGGSWTLQAAGQSRELALQQTYQKLQGTLKSSAESLSLIDSKVNGEEVRFSVLEKGGQRRDYVGRVQGNSMSGTVRAGNQAEAQWSASRK
jgi:hypothetical protein